MDPLTDAELGEIVLASIRRHSMDIATWTHTVVGELHPSILAEGLLVEDELPIVSAHFSEASWYALTTRRIVGVCFGTPFDIDEAEMLDARFGDFKGNDGEDRRVAEVRLRDGEAVFLEYETGKPSMAPIYYFRSIEQARGHR